MKSPRLDAVLEQRVTNQKGFKEKHNHKSVWVGTDFPNPTSEQSPPCQAEHENCIFIYILLRTQFRNPSVEGEYKYIYKKKRDMCIYIYIYISKIQKKIYYKGIQLDRDKYKYEKNNN